MDISRHHCCFEIDPPDVVLRDFSSRNGTFVNGIDIRGLRQRRLHDGDKVRVGRLALHVEVTSDDAQDRPGFVSSSHCYGATEKMEYAI
jgi:pSer/pThr/pTyr-binding forkhead associated (FHA) protein